MSLKNCHNFSDFRKLAKRKLPSPIFHYIDGAADDEVTYARNTSAFDDVDLVPNVLRGVENVDLSTTIFGKKLDLPFYLAPTALQRLFHYDGERAVGKAAKKFNIRILLKGANSIIADNKNAWQLFGTDSQTARAGLGDLLSGFVAGSSAIDLTFCRNITTDFFAKYVLLHSFAASKCKSGSNASAIGDELSKIMRKRKTRQIS